ncbi:rabenosyn-5 [Microcaecilia unicolor]|uniref:Rabenosyn-5 n=1 Tax=Microcaecilia unicolor TaxID=1415580 RepID=A0A6P7YF48_9AMPH|nr:rabenosyn-5 [Microcaecilia unicolor]XP_030061460.1 rabenosyn-5 [Microcaecilia unicolor]XP_030061461.1 rabenosyn-5 [Microcaecilia unicolor]
MAANYPPPFDDQGEVREGFLCPLCLKDLQSFHQLHSHYEEEHSSEDRDVKGQLKSLVQKAKNKLLRREAERTDCGSQERYEAYSYGGVDPYMWEPQELGATKSHLSDFKKHRAARIDHYVVEVNKLIIRLEKLTSFDRTNTDSAKIRAIEKSVVPWVSDQDVPFCPDCGNKFSMRNRRHHCRLCGSIMCKKCMELVLLPLASKLTSSNKPNFVSHGSPNLSPNSTQASRRGSISSVSSISSVLDEKDDEQIRCCQHCKKTLLKREQQIDEKHYTPDIIKLYEKLRLCMERIDLKAPDYIKMAQSINAGETTYSLEHANDLRLEVQKLYELIDALSKKILTLGMNEEPKPPARTQQLQKMIRYSATLFIQEKLLGLMSLPTKENYEALKEKRKYHLERQAALEAHRQLEEKEKDSTAPNGGVSLSRRNQFRKSEGWLPMAGGQCDREISDPLLQQIDNITSFIEQARAANRSDEVKILQENLRQLQDEYEQQQVQAAIELSQKTAEEEAMQREQLEVLLKREREREKHRGLTQHSRTRSLDFREVRQQQPPEITRALDLDSAHLKHSPLAKLSPLQQSSSQDLGCLINRRKASEDNPQPHVNQNESLNPFEEEEADLSNPFSEDVYVGLGQASKDVDRGEKEYNPFEEDQQMPGVASPPSNNFEDQSNFTLGNPFENSSPTNPFEVDGCEDELIGRQGDEAIDEDLLLQQIDNIKAYIFDAKHSGRMDEVELLTENLRELKRTLAKQKAKSK